MTMMLPPDTSSTISVITRPMPVSVTVPTMMPAVAVAMPTRGHVARAALSRAVDEIATSPCARRAANARSPRNSGDAAALRHAPCRSWTTVPQKAERPGDISSTIRHQISTITGSRKCRPVRAVS